MIRMKLKDLKPGMEICRNVFDNNGKLLLAEGTILKNQLIKKLEMFSIMDVMVEVNLSDNQILQAPPTKCDVIYEEAFSAIKDIMEKVRYNQKLEISVIAELVENIVEQIINDSDAFLRLSSIRDLDNYTFLHSIDVCVYAVVLGKTYGLSTQMLNILGMGAILHDIGKGKIPMSILLKPSSLSVEEYDIMKKHTILGYDIISSFSNLDRTIANIALQHHERYDGKGYPMYIKGKSISLLSRIVTICDIYDALTADRVYRGRILPHEAAEFILTNTGLITDPDLTDIFIRNVAIYPLGSTVLLNTGEIGRVININRSMPLRPEIEIFSHRDTDRKIKSYRLNLLENLTVFIEDLVK